MGIKVCKNQDVTPFGVLKEAKITEIWGL